LLAVHFIHLHGFLIVVVGRVFRSLQEFWVQNEEFAQMFRQRLEARYSWHQLERTGGRGDGLVTLLKHAIVVKVPLC